MKHTRGTTIKGLLMAALLAAALPVAAADYLWTGPTNGYNGNAAYWNTYGNWSNVTGGFYQTPNAAGSLVIIRVNSPYDYGDGTFGITLPTTFTAATIGGFTISNRSAHMYGSTYVDLGVPTPYGGVQRVLTLDNGAAPVTLQMDLGTMNFGASYPDNNGGSPLNVKLVSKVLIVTNGNYTYGGGDVTYGRAVVMGGQQLQMSTTLSGGTVADPRAVIVQACTNPGSALSFSLGGTNTSYIGTWTVDGPKSGLYIGRDSALGTSTVNTVTLKNGGTLSSMSDWTITNRSVIGIGTVSVGNTKVLTVSGGGVLIPGDTNAVGTLALVASNVVLTSGSRLKVELGSATTNDLLAVTLKAGSSMTLGGTLDISLIPPFKPSAVGSWSILRTTNGVIQGAFDTTNLPNSWFGLAVSSNEVRVAYTPRGMSILFR